MELYAYNTETMEVIAIANGDDNYECERKMEDAGFVGDNIGWTYSPAFGFNGGLIENRDAEIIE